MDKSNSAYKTIGEVARILNLKSNDKGALPTHVIRFWESQFKQIKPKILNSNRRYYDEKTINLLKKVKFLLKDQGMTIKGVKKILNNPNYKKKNKIWEQYDHMITRNVISNMGGNASVIKTNSKFQNNLNFLENVRKLPNASECIRMRPMQHVRMDPNGSEHIRKP